VCSAGLLSSCVVAVARISLLFPPLVLDSTQLRRHLQVPVTLVACRGGSHHDSPRAGYHRRGDHGGLGQRPTEQRAAAYGRRLGQRRDPNKMID